MPGPGRARSDWWLPPSAGPSPEPVCKFQDSGRQIFGAGRKNWLVQTGWEEAGSVARMAPRAVQTRRGATCFQLFHPLKNESSDSASQ